jgi:hypothetical protein
MDNTIISAVAGVALVVVGLGLVAVLFFLARWLRAKVGAETYDQILGYVVDAVKAAEQLAKSGQIDPSLRKSWVMDAVTEKFPQLSGINVQVLLESAVMGLKLAQAAHYAPTLTISAETDDADGAGGDSPQAAPRIYVIGPDN